MKITDHTRDPIPEERLTEMAADYGVALHEVKLLELKWGYIAHQNVTYGEAEALHAFQQALTYSDLQVGQITVWDGA
jgi:hypothetical protein